MDITIVMTYFNRKAQLLNTLKSIAKHGHDVEIIIIDDGSREEHEITSLSTDKIKVIKLKDKQWINPCIAFNTGFAQATGDVVILQNAECIHIGDIVGYVVGNIEDQLYLNFSAYSINKELTDRISRGEDVLSVIEPLEQRTVPDNMQNGWYNHPIYRPHMTHFCSAITKKDLYDLGGFDERFFDGLGFEDNDFVSRLHKKRMTIKMIQYPYVVHQWHEVHFTNDITPYMELNSDRWEEGKRRDGYDVKPFNNIFK